MENKFLNLDEIQQLVPQLEYHFKKLISHKKEMNKASLRLKKAGFEPKLIEESEPLTFPSEVQRLQESVREHYNFFKQHIIAIETMGGRIRDLELGRVEFNSFEENKVVHWVWQLGVTQTLYREDSFLKVVHSAPSRDSDFTNLSALEPRRASL